MMTRSTTGNSILWRRKNSRSKRFTRLRCTAFPTRRLTTSPNRGRLRPGGPGPRRNGGVWSRLPWACARRKSWRWRSRAALVKRAVPLGCGFRTGAEHRQLLSGVRRRGSPTLRRRGASGLWPGGALSPGARPGCSSVPKTRGCGSGANYWVDRCVLTLIFLIPGTYSKHYINHL